jgi:hypothetical protein
MQTKAKHITDMTCALPREAWTETDSNVFKSVSTRPAGGWRIIDYRAERFNGRMIATHAPDSSGITIPLELDGWHALYIGLAAGLFSPRKGGPCHL